MGCATAHPIRNSSSHVNSCLKSYFDFRTRDLNRNDVLWCKRKQRRLLAQWLSYTSGSMSDIDTLKLVAYESGISPRLGIASLIGSRYYANIFSHAWKFILSGIFSLYNINMWAFCKKNHG